jgi:hypothetical protein
MGPLWPLKSRKFFYWRLQNLQGFTPAAARLIAAVFKLKIGTAQSEIIKAPRLIPSASLALLFRLLNTPQFSGG